MHVMFKKLAYSLGVEELANKLLFLSRQGVRNMRGTDRKIMHNYFSSSGDVKKLHIGCGDRVLSGWLNSDYYTKSGNIIHLDATKAFPFKSQQFDYVFSEHMIEHISYLDGQNMLMEAFRVLKPGGKLRISTPDMSFLIDLYRTDRAKLQNEYIEHSTNKYISYAPFYDATFVINNYVRAWGHKFIYSEKVLRHSMEKAGFKEIARFSVNESQDENLSNLENVDRKPAGMIKMETLVLEGAKP